MYRISPAVRSDDLLDLQADEVQRIIDQLQAALQKSNGVKDDIASPKQNDPVRAAKIERDRQPQQHKYPASLLPTSSSASLSTGESLKALEA